MFKQNLRQKCEIYWPDKVKTSLIFGEITVTCMSVNQNPDFIMRKLRLELVNHYL